MKHLLLLLCLCLPIGALADTEEDKGRLSRFLEDSLSGAGRSVTIDGFTGALSSQASVAKLSIADAKGVWLSLDKVALDWNRAALLKGRLEVNSLTAKTITLTRLPETESTAPSPEATPFSLPDLPVSIEIGTLKADKIALGKDVLGSPLTAKLAGDLSLAGGAGHANLALNRTDDIAGAFILRAAFDNSTRQLTLDLSAQEARDGLVATLLNIPDRPSIALTVSGDAPLSEFEANLTLATDGIPRITGSLATTTQQKSETVSAEKRLTLNIDGDLSSLVAERFHPFFGTRSTLSAQAHKGENGRLHLDHLRLATAAMQITGQATIAPGNLPERFALDIGLSRQGAEALLLPTSRDLSLASASLTARYDATEGDTWTLTGTIEDFIHPDITAKTISLTGGGRIRPEIPRLLTAEMRLLANGLRATNPKRPEAARALGKSASVDFGLDWTENRPLRLNRLTVTTQSGTLNAMAEITGPLQDPSVTAEVTARLQDLAVLAPLAGHPLRGTLDATAQGMLRPLSGAMDMTVTSESNRLRIGIPQIDALTSDGLSRLSIALKRDAEGLSWETAQLTTPALALTSEGQLSTGGGKVSLDASLDSLGRLVPTMDGPARIAARATKNNNRWSLDVTGAGPGGLEANVTGTIAQDLSSADLTTEGGAPLALLNGLTNAIRLTGETRFNLGLRGPLSLDALTGTVEISGTRLSVADPQVTLSNIGSIIRIANGSASISGNGTFDLGGSFDVNGNLSLTAPYTAGLTTRFNSAHLRYERLLETVLLGDMRINGPLMGGAVISGDLTLDKTEIRVDSTTSSSAPLPDITHINTPPNVARTRGYAGAIQTGKAQSGPVYGLDIGVSAPTRIFVRGRGLDAEFGGALRLQGDTKNIITGGNFDLLRGRMSFLTKRFDLTEGTIRLQGDFVPALRLVATTRTNAARFDVTLEGAADAPRFSIAASPDMPEDEALAQLLFGKSLADISPLQAARLAAAVGTLTGGSTFNPLGSLREGAGIDDLDLQTDAEGNTSVTAGKYISDNIYTEVEVGNTGESAISLNLDVYPSLTVKGIADSEANSGLGLFFQKDY